MSAFRLGAVATIAWVPYVIACGTTGTSTGLRGNGTSSASGDTSADNSASADASLDALGGSVAAGDGSPTGAETDAGPNPGNTGAGFSDGGFSDGGGTTDGAMPLVCDGGGGNAASCFTTGDWSVANLEPCFLMTMDGMGDPITTAYASTPGNPVECGLDTTTGAPVVPATWSTDTLEVDCTGVFALCFTLKAGDGTNPQPADCVVAQTCSAAHYGPAGSTMVFPSLPGWASSPNESACAAAFVATGGYGEMSVTGQTDACENVQRVFQTVVYCPTTCGGPDAPAQCATCVSGGGGPF